MKRYSCFDKVCLFLLGVCKKVTCVILKICNHRCLKRCILFKFEYSDLFSFLVIEERYLVGSQDFENSESAITNIICGNGPII